MLPPTPNSGSVSSTTRSSYAASAVRFSRRWPGIQRLITTNSLPDWLRRVVFQYHAALPVALIEPFAASPYWEERYLAARYPRLPEALLNELAHDGIGYVRTVAGEALQHRQP